MRKYIYMIFYVCVDDVLLVLDKVPVGDPEVEYVAVPGVCVPDTTVDGEKLGIRDAVSETVCVTEYVAVPGVRVPDTTVDGEKLGIRDAVGETVCVTEYVAVPGVRVGVIIEDCDSVIGALFELYIDDDTVFVEDCD